MRIQSTYPSHIILVIESHLSVSPSDRPIQLPFLSSLQRVNDASANDVASKYPGEDNNRVFVMKVVCPALHVSHPGDASSRLTL